MWPFRNRSADGGSGRRGERLAEKHLRAAGYKILARNYRCPVGEVDLIALKAEGNARTIAFVEVKTRRSDAHVDPESAVDADKRRRMLKVAQYYLSRRDADDCDARFDVIAVVIPPDGPPTVRHIVAAFEPE